MEQEEKKGKTSSTDKLNDLREKNTNNQQKIVK